jgi:predicted nucleic acid-binding protein
MRVVMDTDVVVAGLRSPRGASRAWLRAALRREAELLLTVPLVLEYEAVLLRPETLATVRLGAAEIGRLLDALCDRAGRVEVSFLWRPTLRTRTTRWCWRPRWPGAPTGS